MFILDSSKPCQQTSCEHICIPMREEDAAGKLLSIKAKCICQAGFRPDETDPTKCKCKSLGFFPHRIFVAWARCYLKLNKFWMYEKIKGNIGLRKLFHIHPNFQRSFQPLSAPKTRSHHSWSTVTRSLERSRLSARIPTTSTRWCRPFRDSRDPSPWTTTKPMDISITRIPWRSGGRSWTEATGTISSLPMVSEI